MNKIFKTLSVLTIASFAASLTACGESSTASDSDNNEIFAEQELSDDEELAEISSSSKKSKATSSSEEDETLDSEEEFVDSEDENVVSSSSEKESTDEENVASSSSKEKKSSDTKKEKSGKFSGKISGVSQKGPFILGSKVTLYEVESESLDQSGSIFGSKTKNDKGEFEVSYKELSSNYAMFVVDGYYRNEVTGKQSTSQITLNALSDLTNRKMVNVNILTHLEFDRVKYLVGTKGIEYGKAKAQAEKEIFDAFGISFKEGSSAEDLDIAGTTENDAALLALSVVLQGTCAEAAFSERLARIAQDLEEDGTIDDKQMLADIADEIALMDLEKVRKNVEAWKLSTSVPDFENYVESFRTASYDIGACTKENVAKTAKNTNKLSKNYEKMYVCEESGWREMTADEAKYGTCSAAENGTRFENSRICDGGEWRSLTANESMGACTEEKIGETAVEGNELSENFEKKHVCDKNGWREMTADESKYGTCAANEDGKRFEKSRICDGGKWRSLTADESMGACTEEKIGETAVEENEINKNFEKKHVCDKNGWRVVNALDEKLGYCLSVNEHQGASDNGQLYACVNSAWKAVNVYNYDTLTLVCHNEGEILHSEQNDFYYVCRDGKITAPTFDDYAINKGFTANIWNGATDSKVKVDESEYKINIFSRFVGIYDFDGNQAKCETGCAGYYFAADWSYPKYDEDGGSSVLEQKGVKYSYKAVDDVAEADVEVPVGGGSSVDASDWEGLCVVYASSAPLRFGVEKAYVSSHDYSAAAKIPASVELTVANLKWEEFGINVFNGEAIDPMTIVKKLELVYVGVEYGGYVSKYAPKEGSVYIAGIGKYNGCSVK